MSDEFYKKFAEDLNKNLIDNKFSNVIEGAKLIEYIFEI